METMGQVLDSSSKHSTILKFGSQARTTSPRRICVAGLARVTPPERPAVAVTKWWVARVWTTRTRWCFEMSKAAYFGGADGSVGKVIEVEEDTKGVIGVKREVHLYLRVVGRKASALMARLAMPARKRRFLSKFTIWGSPQTKPRQPESWGWAVARTSGRGPSRWNRVGRYWKLGWTAARASSSEVRYRPRSLRAPW